MIGVLTHPRVYSANAIMHALADNMGDSAAMLPRGGTIMLGAIEGMLNHPNITSGMSECRQRADKTVLAIDAQHPTLMDVLYQVPHGTNRAGKRAPATKASIACIP